MSEVWYSQMAKKFDNFRANDRAEFVKFAPSKTWKQIYYVMEKHGRK